MSETRAEVPRTGTANALSASSSGQQLGEIVLAPRHQEFHSRVPPDVYDVLSMASQDPFPPHLRKRQTRRVVVGRGKALVVWRETAMYGLSMCGPCGEVIHVGLNILGIVGFIGGRDVGAGVVEGQRADGTRCGSVHGNRISFADVWMIVIQRKFRALSG